MERYSLISTKMKREFILLQGTGCRWKKCAFCDYHTDISQNPLNTNYKVLQNVTGEYGVLDVINSGSCIEIDNDTLKMLNNVITKRNIHTVWFESHYIFRHHLNKFAQQFPTAEVKFRCGIETFNPQTRALWNKGISGNVSPLDISKYFKGVCLLCCVEGQTREQILTDIHTAKKYFEYFSVNVFCNNSTSIQRSDELYTWFCNKVYPFIKDDPKIEVLINNTDLGVG